MYFDTSRYAPSLTSDIPAATAVSGLSATRPNPSLFMHSRSRSNSNRLQFVNPDNFKFCTAASTGPGRRRRRRRAAAVFRARALRGRPAAAHSLRRPQRHDLPLHDELAGSPMCTSPPRTARAAPEDGSPRCSSRSSRDASGPGQVYTCGPDRMMAAVARASPRRAACPARSRSRRRWRAATASASAARCPTHRRAASSTRAPRARASTHATIAWDAARSAAMSDDQTRHHRRR